MLQLLSLGFKSTFAKIIKSAKILLFHEISHFYFSGRPKSRTKKKFCDTVEKGLGPRPLGPIGPMVQGPWGP